MSFLSFDERISQLVEFKREFGHCNVPSAWPTNPRLASWAAEQRRAYRKGELRRDRQARLEAIGFDFAHGISNTGGDLDRRFRILAKYRRERSVDGVPASTDPDPEYASLAKWIERMRRHHNGGTLALALQERLSAAGITLERDLERAASQTGFEEAAFQRNFDRLSVWLDEKEDRDGVRDLAYRDTRSNKEVARCYKFVEHLVLKARQGLLNEAHRAQVVTLGFTVNKRSIEDVLNPGPSARSLEGVELSQAAEAGKRAKEEAKKTLEEAERTIQDAYHAREVAQASARAMDEAVLQMQMDAPQNGNTYLTTDELGERIRYDTRTIREHLIKNVFVENVHFFRPFGGRKILFMGTSNNARFSVNPTAK